MRSQVHDGPLLTGVLIGVAVVGVSMSAPLAAATLAPALAVAFWRNALAVAAGAPFTLVTGGAGELRGLAGRELRLSLLAGALLAVHFALWVPSLRLTSVTASTALVSTTPVWVLLVERARGRPAPRSVAVGVVLAVAGTVSVTGVDAATSSRAVLGDLMALGGGAAAAGYVVAGEEVRRSVSTATYTLVVYTCCAALLLLACLAGGVPLTGYSARTWAELVALTVAAQLLGHSLLNRALRTAGAQTVSLAILLEVPGAALIAWVWLGQVPPAGVVPGAALVLAGLVVVVRGRSRARAVLPGP